jgi:protein-disulfide isomerase
MEPSIKPQSHPAIPIAIVVGFAMIAVAVFFTGGKNTPVGSTTNKDGSSSKTVSSTPRPIDSSDFIQGNPNAPILIVEYSDYDCPFCKQYHDTLSQIMEEYGVTGRVAWVYRQYPIGQLHPNSPNVSKAALCVGSLGGGDAFWKFTDMIFENRELDEPTNPIKLPDYASEAGVSKDEYFACLDSNKMEDPLKQSVADAFDIGARGTPYTVIMVGNEQAVVNGAQSYEVVKSIIDNLIRQLDGNFDPTAQKQGNTGTTTGQ